MTKDNCKTKTDVDLPKKNYNNDNKQKSNFRD